MFTITDKILQSSMIFVWFLGVQSTTIRLDMTSVPPRETTYMCQIFELTDLVNQDLHMIAATPHVANSQVVHHIILRECEDSQYLLDPNHSVYQFKKKRKLHCINHKGKFICLFKRSAKGLSIKSYPKDYHQKLTYSLSRCYSHRSSSNLAMR